MGRTFGSMSLTQPPQVTKFHDGVSVDCTHNDHAWMIDAIDEHPFVHSLRDAILRYRLRSAAHFDVNFWISQAAKTSPEHLKKRMSRAFNISIDFTDFNGPVTFLCRPKFRRVGKYRWILTKKIEVQIYGRWKTLDIFLEANFPALPMAVPLRTMQAWWDSNGRVFKWLQLPTELKEHVLKYCIRQPLDLNGQREWEKRYMSRAQPRFGAIREFGVFEIVDKLQEWSALLRTTHQIRAITLRLCFGGNNDAGTYNQGFCVFASTYGRLKDTLCRLGRYYQMIGSDSLPNPLDSRAQILANCYRNHPRIYPHLKHYATFRHGIRKVCLKWDFVSYMHFFRVTTTGFQHYLQPGMMTYEVFQELPSLADIIISLPGRPRQGWKDTPSQAGPKIFHDDNPCPRLLHRLIYEHIADHLAIHKRVRLRHFMDDDEKQRFYTLRSAAIQNLKLREQDLDELYVECGGGVQLDDLVQPGNWLSTSENTQVQDEHGTEELESFFPPKCLCKVRCSLAFP